MPITVQHQPDFTSLGNAALDIGEGKRRMYEDEQARRDRNTMLQAELAQQRINEQQREFDISQNESNYRFDQGQIARDEAAAAREQEAIAAHERRKELMSLQHGYRVDDMDYQFDNKFLQAERELQAQGYEYTPDQEQQIADIERKSNKIRMQDDLRPSDREYALKELRRKRYAILPSRPKQPQPTAQDIFNRNAVRDENGNLLGYLDPQKGSFHDLRQRGGSNGPAPEDPQAQLLAEQDADNKRLATLNKQYAAMVKQKADLQEQLPAKGIDVELQGRINALDHNMGVYEAQIAQVQKRIIERLSAPAPEARGTAENLPPSPAEQAPAQPEPPLPPLSREDQATLSRYSKVPPSMQGAAYNSLPPAVKEHLNYNPARHTLPGVKVLDQLQLDTDNYAKDVVRAVQAGEISPEKGQAQIKKFTKEQLKIRIRQASMRKSPEDYLMLRRALDALEEGQ